MPAQINRASLSFSRLSDKYMIDELCKLSGQSASAMCGMCLSEYLQHNFFRLRTFYEKTGWRPNSPDSDSEEVH